MSNGRITKEKTQIVMQWRACIIAAEGAYQTFSLGPSTFSLDPCLAN